MADLEELELRLEAARKQQRAVSRVSRAVARGQGLQLMLDEVVETAAKLCGAVNGRLWLFENGLLHAFANFGMQEGFE